MCLTLAESYLLKKTPGKCYCLRDSFRMIYDALLFFLHGFFVKKPMLFTFVRTYPFFGIDVSIIAAQQIIKITSGLSCSLKESTEGERKTFF